MENFDVFKQSVDGLVSKIDGYKNEINEQLKAAKGEHEAALNEMKAEFEGYQKDLKELKAAAGRIKDSATRESFKDAVVKHVKENAEMIERLAAGSVNSFKANVSNDFIEKAVADMTVGTHLTGNIEYTYRPGIVGIPYKMPHVRNLFSVIPSATDSYHYYQHTGGEGSIDWQSSEGATKSQFDEDLAEKTVTLAYLAGFVTITRQMLRNIPALQAYLNQWLPEKYLRAEDSKWYTFMAALSGTTTGATSGTNVERIVTTIATLMGLGYTPDMVLVGAATWGRIMLHKSATSGEYTLPEPVTVADNGDVRIMGIPIVVTSFVADDKAVILQSNLFQIIQSEGLSVRYSEEHASNFVQNKITVRVEAAIAFAALDPKGSSLIDLGDVV